MKPRERQIAVIRHKLPDQIPVDIVSLFEDLDTLAYQLKTENKLEEVVNRLGLDGWRIFNKGYLGPLFQDAGGKTADPWGILDGHPPLMDCDNVRDIEKHHWPDPALWDFSHAKQEACRLKDTLAIRGPGWMFGTLCRAFELMSVEGALMAMKTEPEVFEAVLDHVTQHNVAYLENFLSICGEDVDILWLGDDFATQRGLMISPEDWRHFLLPCFKKLFNVGKKAGKYIWFHSCGDITDVLPDLIDIGMDVWETVQIHTLPISPAKLKKKFGNDVTFFGGIPTQKLPYMSLGEVAEIVQSTIKVLGKGGGYICGPDHQIKVDVSVDKIVTLFEAAKAYRMQEYTLDHQ